MSNETANNLALVEVGGRDLHDSKSLCEELRRQREVHRHKQIWVKEPHGGPYRKVSPQNRSLNTVKDAVDPRSFSRVQAQNGQGQDPLKYKLDGSLRKVELGYHRAETGPTSNFVGNHMTQGAIDLVQVELKQKSSVVLPLPSTSCVPSNESVAPPLHLKCDIKVNGDVSDVLTRGRECVYEQEPLVVQDMQQKQTLAQLKTFIRRRRAI